MTHSRKDRQAMEDHFERDVSFADLHLDTNSGNEVSVESQRRILASMAERVQWGDKPLSKDDMHGQEATMRDVTMKEKAEHGREGHHRAEDMNQREWKGETDAKPSCDPDDRILTGLETIITDSLEGGSLRDESWRGGDKKSVDAKQKEMVDPPGMLVRGLTGLDETTRKVLVERVRLNREVSRNTNPVSENSLEEVDDLPSFLDSELTRLDSAVVDALIERARLMRAESNDRDTSMPTEADISPADVMRVLSSLDPIVVENFAEAARLNPAESSRSGRTHDLGLSVGPEGGLRETQDSGRDRMAGRRIASQVALTIDAVKGVVGAHAIPGPSSRGIVGEQAARRTIGEENLEEGRGASAFSRGGGGGGLEGESVWALESNVVVPHAPSQGSHSSIQPAISLMDRNHNHQHSHNGTNTPEIEREKRKTWIYTANIFIIFLIALVLVVVLPLRLQKQSNGENVVLTRPPTGPATELELRNFQTVIGALVSDQAVFDDRSSYQSRALWWLAVDDPLQLDPMRSSNEKIIQERFALAALYYATNGPGWTRTNMGFLSGASVCEWNSGDSGVNCVGSTTVTSIALSTYCAFA